MNSSEPPFRQQATRQINKPNPGGIPPVPDQASLSTMPTDPPPPRRQKRAAARLVAPILIVSLGAVAASLGGLFVKQINNIGGKRGALSVIESVRNPQGQFPHKDRINILLVGKDYSYLDDKRDPKRNMQRYTKDSRSDTIAIVSLDLRNKTASMLSIPRDTRVEAPKELGSEERITGKINGTYSRGGVQLLRQTVTELLGIAPDYYIAIKPDALKHLVDAVGGVEVETIDAMKYDDAKAGLHIDLPKGKQVINGTEAIGFARFREADIYERKPDGSAIWTGRKDREGNPIFRLKRHIVHSKEEGEPRRIARQQQLIRAMASKAKSVNNLFKLDELVNLGLEQIETDMDRMQLFALAALYRNTSPDKILSDTLRGEGTKRGRYFFIPDEEKKQALVDWLLRGDESAAYSITAVRVLNGTGVPGLAGRVAETLRERGFSIVDVGNVAEPEQHATTDRPVDTRVLFTRASVATRAEKIAAFIGAGTVQKDTRPDTTGVGGFEAENADVTIIIGDDLAAKMAQRSAQR